MYRIVLTQSSEEASAAELRRAKHSKHLSFCCVGRMKSGAYWTPCENTLRQSLETDAYASFVVSCGMGEFASTTVGLHTRTACANARIWGNLAHDNVNSIETLSNALGRAPVRELRRVDSSQQCNFQTDVATSERFGERVTSGSNAEGTPGLLHSAAVYCDRASLGEGLASEPIAARKYRSLPRTLDAKYSTDAQAQFDSDVFAATARFERRHSRAGCREVSR